MAGLISRLAGPLALTTTYTTNIYNPSANTKGIVRQIHVANNGASATYRLFVGATGANAAGTQIAYDIPVAAGECSDLYFPSGLEMTSSDYLVGGTDTATRLAITVIGEKIAA